MRSLFKNDVAVVSLGQLIQQVITFATGIILARMLGASAYGVVNILRTLFVGLMTVAPLGLDLALLKYCGRHEADAPHVVVTVNRLRLISAASNLAIALIIGLGFGDLLMRDVYKYEHFDLMLIITLMGLPFAADLGIMSAYYKAKGRPGVYALMTIYFQPALRLVLVGLAALLWPNAIAVVSINTVQFATSSLLVIAHYGLLKKESGKQGELDAPVPWRESWQVLSESVWMAANLLIYGMMRFVDVLFLGYYVAAHEVGEYSALSTVSQLVQVYPLAASQTLGPTISRYYHADDVEGIRRSLGNYIYLASLVSGFLFAGIAIFGTRLDLVFGSSFHFQQTVSVLMPFGYLLSAMLAPTGYALSMTGRHRAELFILCLGGATLLVLCRLLIPMFGQSGAAMAVAASFFVINVVRFGYVSKVLGFIPGHLRDVVPPLLGLVLAYGSRQLFDAFFDRNLLQTAAACVLYTLLYALVCQLFLFRDNTREAVRRQVLKLVRRPAPSN